MNFEYYLLIVLHGLPEVGQFGVAIAQGRFQLGDTRIRRGRSHVQEIVRGVEARRLAERVLGERY